MGWFSRRRSRFWRQAPLQGSSDVELLSAHGMNCRVKGRFEELIATGFALMSLSGITENNADYFVRDGFRGWSQSPEFDQRQAADLLSDLIETIANDDYALLGWAVTSRLDALSVEDRNAWEADAYLLLAAAPSRGDLTTGAIVWATQYAAQHGKNLPW